METTDDLRILAMKELTPPAHLIREFPCEEKAAETVSGCRKAIQRVLHNQDDRLVVIMGPCSIHDPKAAMEYAHRLAEEKERYADELVVVMRVYFEKPRTTIGWKGLINDPFMDHSYRINEGLHIARELLRDVNELGLPAATEYLDMISPQYVADMISWGDWCKNDGITGSSRTVFRFVLSCRFQERYGWQYQDCHRCHQGRFASASLPFRHERRSYSHFRNTGQ